MGPKSIRRRSCSSVPLSGTLWYVDAPFSRRLALTALHAKELVVVTPCRIPPGQLDITCPDRAYSHDSGAGSVRTASIDSGKPWTGPSCLS